MALEQRQRLLCLKLIRLHGSPQLQVAGVNKIVDCYLASAQSRLSLLHMPGTALHLNCIPKL